MQSRSLLAYANSIKLKQNGKDITLYDIFDIKDHRLILKENITKSDGTKFTMEDFHRFTLQARRINQKLHGIYNEADKSAIQQHSIGRAALMFRKWIEPGLNRRFQSNHYDYIFNYEQEGYYRTLGKFIKGIYDEMKLSKLGLLNAISKSKNNLNENEIANIKRAFTEISYFIGSFILGGILTRILGDADEDEMWVLNYLAYQTLRMQTEIGFFVPIVGTPQLLKIVQSPMAGLNNIENIMDLTKSINLFGFLFEDKEFFRTYKTGDKKGTLYLTNKLQDLVPIWNQIGEYDEVSEKIKFLEN